MRHRTIASLALALTAACTVAAAPQPETFAAEPQTFPSFDEWGTGEGPYAYHRLSGTCDTLTHAFGRNAAWGLWRMSIWAVDEGQVEEAADGTAELRLTCRDGSACIEQGALDDTPERVTDHAIPFGTPALAKAFSDRLTKHKGACRQYL
jgi:hypothetical protein